MVEKILGERQAKDIFFSAMLTGMMTEKQAEDALGMIEKRGQATMLDWLKGIGGALTHGGGMIADTVKAIPPALGWTALLGASAGGLGAMSYDAIKERVSSEDPEAKFNADVESYYAGKKRELTDSKWMAKVRSMRDELKRGYKKMPPSEYARKYKALIAALDEKKPKDEDEEAV